VPSFFVFHIILSKLEQGGIVMSFKRLFIATLIISVLAGAVMLLSNILQNFGIIATGAGLCFVSFIAWSCYFFGGGTPKDAVISWMSFIVGIACAILIFVCNTLFTHFGWSVSYLALPLAVVIGVIPMCLAERFPVGNRVPAVYLGAATFFGAMEIPSIAEKGYVIVAVGELLYAIIGLFAGFLTVWISNFVASYKKAEKHT
jgi:hypothetical protein